MWHIILIISTAFILNGELKNYYKKNIKEKREYDIEILPDGTKIRKLKMTTTYSIDGLIVSEIEACSDSICCPYNKSFRLHQRNNEYWYKDNRLVLRVFRLCDSLPAYKHFYEYKFDNKKRMIEEKEIVFNYETDTIKYEDGKWMPAIIGDSTLTDINIKQFTYNEYDSIIEEKVIIRSKYREEEEVSWIVKYEYDKNGNLIQIEHPGDITLKEIRYYDEKNKIIKIKSNLTMENIIIDIEYNERGDISSIQKQFDDKKFITKYQYNNNGLLIVEESEGNRTEPIRLRYFYNEFNNLVREETSFGNKPPYVKEYEYEYYK